MTHLEKILNSGADKQHIKQLIKAVIADTRNAIKTLPIWERFVHVFWLLGPFILLIERSPADAWLTIISICFVFRTFVSGDTIWLKKFWVRAGFVFWFWCIACSAISTFPGYSLAEALIWFRFPLFAMATAFWLTNDRRLFYAMLVSTAIGLLLMCMILMAELIFVGQVGNRLTWPYGDSVPGGYLAKVGLPAFTIMVALAVSIKGRVAAVAGIVAIFSLVMSLLSGERIHFLIRACGGVLAGLVWKPKWDRFLVLVVIEIGALWSALFYFPNLVNRFTNKLVQGVVNLDKSPWLQTLYGGWSVAKDNLFFGIGTANYRLMSHDLLKGVKSAKPDVHPHNFYLQLLIETGLVGLILGVIFLWSIIWYCFKQGLKCRDNVVVATAWVIPLALLWPIKTDADFFGQWNNVFVWSALALALSVQSLESKQREEQAATGQS